MLKVSVERSDTTSHSRVDMDGDETTQANTHTCIIPQEQEQRMRDAVCRSVGLPAYAIGPSSWERFVEGAQASSALHSHA